MGPGVLLGGWPVKGVETKDKEAGNEEGIGEGQNPGVHGPHQGQLQASVGGPYTVEWKTWEI